jgi:hypothetical protein
MQTKINFVIFFLLAFFGCLEPDDQASSESEPEDASENESPDISGVCKTQESCAASDEDSGGETSNPDESVAEQIESTAESSDPGSAKASGEEVSEPAPIIYSEAEIIALIEVKALEYDVPYWFLQSIVARESYFDPTEENLSDGIGGEEAWEEYRPECAFTDDGYPHGLGLTQLTGWMYQGSPYPFCLDVPDNDETDYYWAMNFPNLGDWIAMDAVTPLSDPFDPEQNLDRFLSGFAAPLFDLFQIEYGELEEDLWRRVAYHWNKGLWVDYDETNEDYLTLYDTYIETYQDPSDEVTVAFIGDQGLGTDAEDVLMLILNEGADMVLHQGDFDYTDDAVAWDAQITAILGADFPYFASIGNHDEAAWNDYQEKLQARLDLVPNAECSGDLGVNSSCSYLGIFFILSGIGTSGSDHETYLSTELAASTATWEICSWHKNQRFMQVGEKTDETGWEVYDTCRAEGAIIATAHEHSYSRTHLLSDFENQVIAGASSTLEIEEGSSFAFVSGLGGKSIRAQNDTLAVNEWWASIYSETQSANYGALFCTFFRHSVENRASCTFKDIDGNTVDQFDLIKR